MKAAITKKEVSSVLADRFGDVFERRERRPVETVATGVAELDGLLPGFPRGAITEIHGAPSSGRTSLLLATLARATNHEEICALVDCSDTFEISSAARAGIDFRRLLWVRCSDNLERAFKAADMLLHAGGFGLVVLNLTDVPVKLTRRIISSWWFRFRRTIENTPTAVLVITSAACTGSCAALVLNLQNEETVWPGTLSLVSENRNSSFTKREEKTPARLSLVRNVPRKSASPALTHSHFIEGFQVSINRSRPREWSDVPLRFKTLIH